jgi:hypothetical protein
MAEKQWTVKDLVEALRQFPEEAKVYYEMGPNGPERLERRNTSRPGVTTIRWECFSTVRRELINLGASSHRCSKRGSENISHHSPPEPHISSHSLSHAFQLLAQKPHLESVRSQNDFAFVRARKCSFVACELDLSDMQPWNSCNHYGSTTWPLTFQKPPGVDLYAALCGAAPCLIHTSPLA